MSSTSGITLLGMGNPLLDISADVTDELLTKYALESNNAILAEEKHQPLYKELVDSFQVQYIGGGATQNSIRVAQWMLKVPGLTAFMGCVGQDDFGSRLKACAADDGVDAYYMEVNDTPTGTCAVLINGNNRSLVANLAAANKFSESHLATPKAEQLIESAQYYYIASFFLTVSVPSILTVAKHAAEHYKTFMMNLSAPFLVQFFWDQMSACLPYTDYVFGNESEAEALGEKQGWGKDVSTIALKLAAMPKASGTRPRTVIITQGSGSTLVAQLGKVQEFPVELLPKDQLVDTNGAGDAFVGGFVAQLIKGESLAKCVEAGHWAARVIIQRSGCTFPSTCEYN